MPKNELAERVGVSPAAFGMRAPGAAFKNGDALVYWSQAGVTQTVAQPQGTSGYDDLRRKAERLNLVSQVRLLPEAPV